jgi:hypothetical protein
MAFLRCQFTNVPDVPTNASQSTFPTFPAPAFCHRLRLSSCSKVPTWHLISTAPDEYESACHRVDLDLETPRRGAGQHQRRGFILTTRYFRVLNLYFPSLGIIATADQLSGSTISTHGGKPALGLKQQGLNKPGHDGSRLLPNLPHTRNRNEILQPVRKNFQAN